MPGAWGDLPQPQDPRATPRDPLCPHPVSRPAFLRGPQHPQATCPGMPHGLSAQGSLLALSQGWVGRMPRSRSIYKLAWGLWHRSPLLPAQDGQVLGPDVFGGGPCPSPPPQSEGAPSHPTPTYRSESKGRCGKSRCRGPTVRGCAQTSAQRQENA